MCEAILRYPFYHIYENGVWKGKTTVLNSLMRLSHFHFLLFTVNTSCNTAAQACQTKGRIRDLKPLSSSSFLQTLLRHPKLILQHSLYIIWNYHKMSLKRRANKHKCPGKHNSVPCKCKRTCSLRSLTGRIFHTHWPRPSQLYPAPSQQGPISFHPFVFNFYLFIYLLQYLILFQSIGNLNDL